jgi:uncharacterized protein YegJ (DUF2314 family)
MFFKKKKKNEEMVEQPLNYWEELSFVIVPYIDDNIDKETIIDRLKKHNINVVGFAESSKEKPGRIVYKYNGNSYEINYFEEEFNLPDLYEYQARQFTKEELEELKKCNKAITFCLEMTDNFEMEYKMQLKIACSILDKTYAIIDESSETIMHPKKANWLANSKSLLSSKSLYSIHAVSDNGKIWLHTHGLNRFGIPDLEVLNSNEDNYGCHQTLITTLADTLIHKGLREDNKYFIGFISDEIPLHVSLLSWADALNKYYTDIDLGGPLDRQEEHNSNYKVIFTYAGDESLENGILSKMEIYDGAWSEERLFFLSNEETKRMREVAQENFEYLKKYFVPEEENALVKIGFKTDSSDDYEHMWLQLLKFNEDGTFDAELMSEPYEVSSMKKGDIGTYNKEQLTDWLLYVDEESYIPDDVYKLD